MIIQWKRIGPMEYRALWQGKALCLEYKPLEHCWRMKVDAMRVRQRWTSPVSAFNAVETILNKIIRAQMAVVPQVKPFMQGGRRAQT